MFDKVHDWYRQLPDKKKYVEFVSAILSVPVLVTVILINMNNLTHKDTAKSTDKLTPSYIPSVTVIREEKLVTPTPGKTTPTPDSITPVACQKAVGPVVIASPQENQVISDDYVSIDISAQTPGFCPVEWSYSLDGATWSNYSNKNISLYNLNTGNHQINIKVKSTESNDEITLRRTFYYDNPHVTLEPTQSATDSASTL